MTDYETRLKIYAYDNARKLSKREIKEIEKEAERIYLTSIIGSRGQYQSTDKKMIKALRVGKKKAK